MKKSTSIGLFYFLFSIGPLLNGQEQVERFPVRFIQYNQCYTLINPASAGTHNQYEITAGNQRMIGKQSKVSTYFLNANMRVMPRSKNNKTHSTIGVTLYNDREGKYLNRTRFYAIYAWHGHITKKLMVSGGLSVGAMSYSVKGTPLSGNGSDVKSDASVGVQVYNQSFHTGISFCQLFNSKLQPLEEVTVLTTYSAFFGDYKIKLAESLAFTPSVCMQLPLSRKYSDSYLVLYDASFKFNLYNRFDLAAGIYNKEKIAVTVGATNVIIASGRLGIHVSYAFLYKQSVRLGTPQIEIGINYSIN